VPAPALQLALCQPSIEAVIAASDSGESPLVVNSGVLDTAVQVAHKRCRAWDDDTLDGQGDDTVGSADGVAPLPAIVTGEEWQVLRYCDVHLPGGPVEQAAGTLRREAQGKEIERAVNIRRQALMRRAVKRGQALSGEALARVFALSSVPTLSAFLSARQRRGDASTAAGAVSTPPLMTATDLAALAASEDPLEDRGAAHTAGVTDSPAASDGELPDDGGGTDDADDERGGGGGGSTDETDDDRGSDSEDDHGRGTGFRPGDPAGGAGGGRGVPAVKVPAGSLPRAHTMPAGAAGSGAVGAKRLVGTAAKPVVPATATAIPAGASAFGAPPAEENLDDFNNGILTYGGRFKDRSVVTAVNLKLWRERLMREGATDGVTDVFNRSLGNPEPTVTAASDGRFAAVAPLTVAQWRQVVSAVAQLQATASGNQRFLDALVPRNAWIVKPAGKSRGRGIECARTLADILDARGGDGHRESQWIAQRYIERPLLIRGLKWDVRQWVLVTAMNPLTVYVYDRFYLRFCCYPFELDNLSNRYIHLSNNSIQKHATVFDATAIEGNMWHMASFAAWLQEQAAAGAWDGLSYVPDPAAQAGDCNTPPWDGDGTPPEPLPVTACSSILDCVIRPQMRRLITQSLQAAQDRMEGRPGSFELYGYDFMVDADLNVWLIEINASPDLSYSTPVTEALVKDACAELFAVVLDREGLGNGPPPNPAVDTGGWKCVYRSPVTLPRTLTCTAHSIICTGTAMRPASSATTTVVAGSASAPSKRRPAGAPASVPLRTSSHHSNAAAAAVATAGSGVIASASSSAVSAKMVRAPMDAAAGTKGTRAPLTARLPPSAAPDAQPTRLLRKAPSHTGAGGMVGMGLAARSATGTGAPAPSGGLATTAAAAAAVKQRTPLRLAAGSLTLEPQGAGVAEPEVGSEDAVERAPATSPPSALSPSLTGRSSIPVHRSRAPAPLPVPSLAPAPAQPLNLAPAFDLVGAGVVRGHRPASAAAAGGSAAPAGSSASRKSARSTSRGGVGSRGSGGMSTDGLAVTVAPLAAFARP